MLDKDLFMVLAAVASADGNIDADELRALERAARDHGIDDAGVRSMTDAARGGLASLDLTRTAEGERTFVYAMAYWMSRLDGDMSETEDAVLTTLGKKLALEDAARMGAEAAVDEVAAMPEGDRPERFDLERLRALLASRLH
jgi:uncharacterized membrane protein YebE (DUF533 family)